VEAGLEPVRIPSPSGDWEWVKEEVTVIKKEMGGLSRTVAYALEK